LAVPLYADFETEEAVVTKYIQIGVLYQNDNFGKDHVRGLRAGLGTKASQIVAVASYDLSDPAIDSQIITDSMSAAKADGRPPTSVPGQVRPV
jgi:branched-chain amino acid transport system substrate-binding protein